MVMKKFLFTLASFAMLFASCNKETPQVDPSEPTGKYIYSINVALNDTTKATLGEPEGISPNIFRKVTWNTGDQICVNGCVSDALDSQYDGKESAVFTFKDLQESSSYMACYPASVYVSDSQVNLPAVQGDAQGANKAKSFPLAAKVSDITEHITLMQLCGFIRIKLQGDNNDLDYVEFIANGTEKVSGVFDIEFSDGVPALTAPSGTVEPADRKVRVNCTPKLTDSDKYCVIGVPAQTYESGLNLVMVRKDNMGYSSNSTKKKTIKRAEVTNISNVFNVGISNYVNIATADQWNTFATQFNAGKCASDIVANIAADLDFTDKGITTINKSKAFAGTIYGNDCSFKNVQLANDAIVGTLAADGVIKNVKIDGDSKMTMSAGSTNAYFGPLVGDLQGSIEDCESAADMEFLVSSEKDYFIGGIVGRARGGSIKNCKVSGTLKDTEKTDIGNSTYAYVGGITSDVNDNPEETQHGSLIDCEFSGKILMGPYAGTDNTGATGITGKNTENGFRIGGIVGRAQNGTVTNCSTTSSAVVDIRGDLLSIFVGGIVGNGQDEIKTCTNAAAVSVWSANTDASGGYARVAGVAGYNSGTLSGCSNSGKVYMRAQHRNSYYGGINGINYGTVTNCTNSGEILEDTYRPRYLYIGGVLGGNTVNGTVTDIHNTGSVTVETVPNNSTMGTTGCGGVIGYNLADIVGNNNIDNTGTVTVNIAKTTYLNVSAGGIIGINKASLSGVTNKGKVLSTCSVSVTTSSFTAFGGIIGSQQNGATAATISNCTNDRGTVPATTEFIYANITSTTASTCMNWCEGGVIGYVYDSNLAVTNCTNNSYVRYAAADAATAGRTSYTGGIIGKSNANISISQCANLGGINGWNSVAGIIGHAGPSSQISECFNTGVISGAQLVGGIVGAMAASTSENKGQIRDCYAKGNVNVATQIGGGIVGDLDSYNDMSACYFSSASVKKSTELNTEGRCLGGIAGRICGGGLGDNTAHALGQSYYNTVKYLISWPDKIESGGSADYASSGAVTGYNATKTSYRYCYRRLDSNVSYNFLYVPDGITAPVNQGQTTSNVTAGIQSPYWYPYHANAATASFLTVTSVAAYVNTRDNNAWNTSIWNLDADFPTLKNNPEPVQP